MLKLHEHGLSTHAMARRLRLDRRHVARTLRALLGQQSASTRVDQNADAAADRQRTDDAAIRRQERRALLIEAGLAWLTLFGELPNTKSWNASKARADGPESFLRHEFVFISRFDGKPRSWPSPDTIARHFRSDKSLGTMNEYLGIVWRLHAELSRNGTPYQPILLEESLNWAGMQASSRASMEDPKMRVPDQVLCSSRDGSDVDADQPARVGSTSWGPIRIPRLADRGVCLLVSPDWDRRYDLAGKLVCADCADEDLGVLVFSTPTAVTIRSRTGGAPHIDRLHAPDSSVTPSGVLSIQEAPSDPAENDPLTSRESLLTALRWALDYQNELSATGTVSLVVAEAQAEGQSVLSGIIAFKELWFAGNLAVTALIDPWGSPEELLLAGMATTEFEFFPGNHVGPADVFDPGYGTSQEALEAIRSAIRSA